MQGAFPPVDHPLVRTHPVTGRRALFVAGGFMDQIVGMHREESDALLGYLARHIENPNFCVRWHWQPNDLAMWDEASTNHRALSDHYPAHRIMRRCTVEGSRPSFVSSEELRSRQNMQEVVGDGSQGDRDDDARPRDDARSPVSRSWPKAGQLSWMTSAIQLETAATGKAGAKGVFGAVKRAVSGGSLFMTEYTAEGARRHGRVRDEGARSDHADRGRTPTRPTWSTAAATSAGSTA